MGDRGVRVHPPARRVLDRLVDAAAEEEPRHRRAGAGQGRPGRRRSRRLPHDAQGPPARLQPRSPGRQGAALRRARHLRAVVAGAGRDARRRRVRRRAHGDRGRQLDDGRDRSRRAPGARGVPFRDARRGRHPRAAVDRAGRALRRARRDRPASRPQALSLLEPGAGVHRRATPGADRRRSSRSSSRPATGWRSSASGSRIESEQGPSAIVLRPRRTAGRTRAAQQGARGGAGQ